MNDLETLIPGAIAAVAFRSVSATLWAETLEPFMWSSGITTPYRVAAFLGQVAVESAGFSVLTENMDYSASRLCQVWPSRFDPPLARTCAGNPESIANVVYANRMGNGGPDSGDGWRCRGAGLLQLTGRTNHTAFATAAKMDPAAVGDYMRTPRGAAHSACWFWSARELNTLADAWLLTRITQVVNGGTEGLVARIAKCNAARRALGV